MQRISLIVRTHFCQPLWFTSSFSLPWGVLLISLHRSCTGPYQDRTRAFSQIQVWMNSLKLSFHQKWKMFFFCWVESSWVQTFVEVTELVMLHLLGRFSLLVARQVWTKKTASVCRPRNHRQNHMSGWAFCFPNHGHSCGKGTKPSK